MASYKYNDKSQFTQREKDVWELHCQNLAALDIMNRLQISHNAVRKALRSARIRIRA